MEINIKKIIALRKLNNLTISRVAEYLGKARSTVSNWENGKTEPTKTDLLALAQLLGTDISSISNYKNLPVNANSSDDESFAVNRILSEAFDEINRKEFSKQQALDLIKNLLAEKKLFELKNRSLKKNNLRLLSIMSSIHEIIYIKDSKRNFKKVNDKFLEQLKPGYTEEDIIGLNSIDIFGRREFEEIIRLESSVFDSGNRIIDFRIKIPQSAGKKIGLISIEPIFDDLDKVSEIAVSIKDISDIVENIDKLEQLKSISNKLDEQIWVATGNPFRYRFVGGSNFLEIYGIAKEEYIKNPLFMLKIIHPKDKMKYDIDDNYFSLVPGEYTFRVVHENNKIRWIECKVFRTTDSSNRTILYGINTDITIRKENELKREMMEKAMCKIEDAMWVYDSNINCILITEAADKLYGVSFKDIDDPIEYWHEKVLAPECRKDYMNKFNEFVEKKKENPYFVPETLIFKALMPDGGYKYIESIFTCMEFNDETYDIAVDRDITEHYNIQLKQRKIKTFIDSEKNIPQKIKKYLESCL